jgi:hypothetical protein
VTIADQPLAQLGGRTSTPARQRADHARLDRLLRLIGWQWELVGRISPARPHPVVSRRRRARSCPPRR